MNCSESLPKTAVSTHIFDVALPPAEKPLIERLAALCRGYVDTLDRVREIRAVTADLLASRQCSANARAVTLELNAELAEIASNLHLARSQRSQLACAVLKYRQRIYATLRQDSRFDSVLVEAHAEREAIMISGRVKSRWDLALLGTIASRVPCELPVEYQVVTPAGPVFSART